MAYGAFAQAMAGVLEGASEDLIAAMVVQAVRAEKSAGRTEPVLAAVFTALALWVFARRDLTTEA